MSYLNLPRLHFAGRFQAAVSTVNNDPTHYDNAHFKPEYQQRSAGNSPNGWWNPRGDANWRMIGCAITAAELPDGNAAAKDDPVLHCSVADADLAVAGKLVDLDPEQQLVSEIWGLSLRIATSDGRTLLRSKFEPAPFMNIWDRWPEGHGDGMAGAIYQSVLTNLEWADVSSSPFLSALKSAADDGLLSIKFNVDAYDTDFQSPTFTLGRIAGTIGPAAAQDPKFWVPGRQFMPAASPNGHFFGPAGRVNFSTAIVDSERGRIVLDLGNALPTKTMGGPFVDIGPLSLGYMTFDAQGNPFPVRLGGIDYLADGWYERTAGIVTVPEDRELTKSELDALAGSSLVLLCGEGDEEKVAVAESVNGVYVRADKYVFRLNPGESATLDLQATTYGQPYPNASVVLYPDPSQLQGGPGAPPPGVPVSALAFPSQVTTGADGKVQVTVTASDPGNPRSYIDGQVYGIRPVLLETLPGSQYNFNPWEYVSLLVYDAFSCEEPVWEGCLQPIFQQYANLYPLMDRFLDLSSYESVCANLIPLQDVFGLDIADPNAMPVSRDLSAAKRKAILTWLNVAPGEKPPRGKPSETRVEATAAVPAPAASAVDAMRGGKTVAVKKRLGHRRSS